MSLSCRHITGSPNTISANDDFVIFDGPSAQVAFLPAVNSVPPGSILYIANPSNGTATITPSGSATIDGNPSLIVSANGRGVIISDGTNWFTVSAA